MNRCFVVSVCDLVQDVETIVHDLCLLLIASGNMVNNGNNPALSPTPHNRKSHRGKVPKVKPPVILDNKKVIALHHSPAIARLSP